MELTEYGLWILVARKVALVIKIINNGTSFDKISVIDLHTIYLVTSLGYYDLHESYISDNNYDKLCRYMLLHYEKFKGKVRHPEKTLDKDSLTAGTGYAIKYPSAIHEIVNAYRRLIHINESKEIE